MAIYTTQLRSIVEQAQTDAHVGPDDFTVAYARLGLSDYPIFDESYRPYLNDKIIRHYYFQEIGAETAARFAWYVRNTLFEMMPYFNQLYASLNLVTDPITNVKYTYQDVITESKTDAGTSSQTTSGQTSHNKTETHDGDDVTEAAKGAGKVETLQHGHNIVEDQTHGHRVIEELQHGHHVTEDMTHGHEIVEELEHGHVETDTTTYGHEIDESGSTTYGRTQATVNGGSDQTLEGATHEREIRSDTPMNQIPSGGVENLNYATEVTYTDREGQRAGSTTYGGTTNVTYGGTDTETSSTEHGGIDVLQKLHDGADTTTTTNAGTDSKTVTNTGADTTTTANSGTDTKETANTGTDTTTTTTSGADTTTLSHGEVITTVESGTSSGSKSETDSRQTDTDGTRSHERIGYDGISQSKLLEEFRKTFLNVDLQVIASLQQCFFGLWA